jgi:hypothetical protein
MDGDAARAGASAAEVKYAAVKHAVNVGKAGRCREEASRTSRQPPAKRKSLAQMKVMEFPAMRCRENRGPAHAQRCSGPARTPPIALAKWSTCSRWWCRPTTRADARGARRGGRGRGEPRSPRRDSSCGRGHSSG